MKFLFSKDVFIYFPIWHASQTLSFSKETLGKPLTSSFLFICVIRFMFTCPNLIFHNLLSLCMLEKHLSWPSYFEISVVYTFSFIWPMKMILSF